MRDAASFFAELKRRNVYKVAAARSEITLLLSREAGTLKRMIWS